MKKLIILMMLFALNASAQVTFEKSYHHINPEEIALSACEDGASGYVVAIGKKRGSSSQLYSFGLIHLNGYGDTIWYKNFAVDHHPEIKQVKKASDGYCVLGIADDTAQVNSTGTMYWITKFDTLGNIVWESYYSSPYLGGGEDRIGLDIMNNDTIFVSTGYACFFSVDGTGQLLNITSLPNYYPSIGYFQSDKLFKQNGIYNFIFTYTLTPPTNLKLKLLNIKSNADTLKTIDITLDSARGNSRFLKPIGNSNLLILGFRPLVPNDRGYFISRVDSAGAKIFEKRVPKITGLNCYVSSNAVLQNGNSIICGFPKITSSLTTPPEGKAFLYCFNDNGDSLWYKEFRGDTLHKTEFYDVIATADSGILACGQILMPDNSRRSYIVKLDSDGNLFNPLSIVRKKKETYLHLYPNPASDYTSFHYMGLEKNVRLTVYNVEGRLMDSFQLNGNDTRLTISTSHYPQGVYTCNLSAEGVVLTSKKLSVIR